MTVRGVEMDREDIPGLVKGLRVRMELTQEQFAQKVGVTFSTVNHWENGKRTPQPYLVQRLLELKRELDADTRGGKRRA
jgi:transcriptional regulator with XRE-family HTH domain